MINLRVLRKEPILEGDVWFLFTSRCSPSPEGQTRRQSRDNEPRTQLRRRHFLKSRKTTRTITQQGTEPTGRSESRFPGSSATRRQARKTTRPSRHRARSASADPSRLENLAGELGPTPRSRRGATWPRRERKRR